MTTTNYIATDRDGTAIYGTGNTAEAAIDAANELAPPWETGAFLACRATAELVEEAEAGRDAVWMIADESGEEAMDVTYWADNEVDADRYIATLRN